MLRATDVVGLASASCVIAAILLSLPGIAWLRRKAPLPTLFMALALPMVPVGTLPVAGYVRGVLGDLSVTTTLLLLVCLLRPVLPLSALPVDRSRLALQALAATAGLVLYPLALGFGPADPFRLGFAHTGFVCTLLLIAAAAGYAGLHFVAICLALAALAWAVGTGESRNLWNYLLDPVLVAWALASLAWRLASRRGKDM